MFTYNGIKVAGLVIILGGLFEVYEIKKDLILTFAKWMLIYYLIETFIILKYVGEIKRKFNIVKKPEPKKDIVKDAENKLIKIKEDIAKAQKLSSDVDKALDVIRQTKRKENEGGDYNH